VEARAATDAADTSGAPLMTNTAGEDRRDDFRAHKPGSVRLVAGCGGGVLGAPFLFDRVPVNCGLGRSSPGVAMQYLLGGVIRLALARDFGSIIGRL
jgi:hypothetical protein